MGLQQMFQQVYQLRIQLIVPLIHQLLLYQVRQLQIQPWEQVILLQQQTCHQMILRLLQLLKKLLLPRQICQQIILLFLQLLNKPKRQLKSQQGKNKCAVLGAVFAKIKTQRHGVIEARRIAKVSFYIIYMHKVQCSYFLYSRDFKGPCNGEYIDPTKPKPKGCCAWNGKCNPKNFYCNWSRKNCVNRCNGKWKV